MPTGAEEEWEKQQRQQKDWDKLSLKQKFDFIQGGLHFPALTLMVFARRKLGYRMLNPTFLFVTGFLLVLIQNVQMPYFPIGQATSIWPYPLTLFVVAMLVWALIQRQLRWREIKAGNHWHTYSRGVSYFSFLPIPEHMVMRFVDPAVCMLVGLLCWWLVSSALGLWIMFASLAFFVSEQRNYDLILGRTLDMLDDLEEAHVKWKFLGDRVITTATSAPRRIEDTSGIPTGIGDDLVLAVQRRRAEAAKEAQANDAAQAA